MLFCRKCLRRAESRCGRVILNFSRFALRGRACPAMERNTMQKVIVIGCPGSGKSTFSRALHAATGLPLYPLDRMYWNADGTRVPKAVFLRRLQQALEKEAWIIDGNYSSTMELRMQFCDTVFFLDYPLEVCLEGIRARKGKERPDMPAILPEDDDRKFVEFIKSYNTGTRPEVMELLRKYAGKQTIVFKSREEANRFLSQMV